MIVGLLLLSLIIMLGGAPDHDRLGFRYWRDFLLSNPTSSKNLAADSLLFSMSTMSRVSQDSPSTLAPS